MPRLADLQTRFSGALCEPDKPVPAGVVAPGGGSAARRYAVYRNNVIVSLTEALAGIFPAIQSLLGEEYFAALAREFIRSHPPAKPVLSDYGEDFGAFLDAFPPLSAFPYLGDVARLERAWLSSYHAADAKALDAAQLAALEGEQLAALRFTLHPAARFLASRWPILALFDANRGGDAVPDFRAGGEAVLVTRPGLEVELLRLAPGAFAFFQALGEGETLGEASAKATDAAPSFDLASALRQGLRSGAFCNMTLAG